MLSVEHETVTHLPRWVAWLKSLARPLTATSRYREHVSAEQWPGVSHQPPPRNATGETLAPDCLYVQKHSYAQSCAHWLTAISGSPPPDIYEADGEIDWTVVILWASFKGRQSLVYYCVEEHVPKRHRKAGYRQKLYFHILQTYHQNDHNTIWQGQESQIKALWKSKHTDITVVVSPR